MRSFQARSTLDPVPAAVLRWLRDVDQGQGKEALFRHEAPAVLDALASRSRVESVIASNEIENITAPRDRAEAVIADGGRARNRTEQELAGYNAALDDVYGNPFDEISVARLLAWHRELFRYAGPDVAGRLKRYDNVVKDIGVESERVRFVPPPASETEFLTEELVQRYSALRSDDVHPVIATAAFVLDFLVIHPFEDGNGRTARIATNALLLRSGYEVCRYISIERLLERNQSRYYDTLEASTAGWREGEHTIWPWAEFLAEMLAVAYRDLEHRAVTGAGGSRRSIVKEWLRLAAPRSFGFAEARTALAGVPEGAVRSVLNDGRDAGALTTQGAGRGTRWVFLDRDAVSRIPD